MIPADAPLKKIIRVVQQVDDLEEYDFRKQLENLNLTDVYGGFDDWLVTEAHRPMLVDIINRFASEADPNMWAEYISRDRPLMSKLSAIWADIKLRRKEAKKKPILEYVPQPTDKAKVYKQVLEMDDSEFEYLKQLRKQIAEERAEQSSKRVVIKRLILPKPPGPVPPIQREENILENFPNKYIPPPPEPLPRYVDSDEYKDRHSEDDDEKPAYPKFKDQSVEFIKDRLYDAATAKKNTAEEYLKKLLQKLNAEPFETEIDLRKLDTIKEESLEQLIEWFENNIASRLSDRIYVKVYFSGGYKVWNLPLNLVIDKVRKLLSEGPLFSIDEDNSMPGSDTFQELYWNVVDKIKFFESFNAPQKKLRKSHANGFFPRKLKKEYAEFEEVLERYQIYHSYTTHEGNLKAGVRTSCLINCLELSGVSKDICLNILALVGHRKRIERTMLTTIGNEFNLAFHVRIVDSNGEIKVANKNDNGWYGNKAGQKIMLAEYLDHFFIDEPTKICLYSVKHWADICEEADHKPLSWRLQVFAQQNGVYKSTASRAKATSLEVIRELDRVGAFESINANSDDVQKAQIFTSEVKEEEAVAREYVKEHETRPISPKQKSKKEYKIYYADIETCKKTTDTGDVVCIPFMLCASDVNGSWKRTYTGIGEDSGFNCVDKFMLDLPKNALVYFHNLGFDGNFFKRFGHNVMIQKGSKIMTMQANINNKTVILRDSYSLLAKPLRDFPRMFQFTSPTAPLTEKEVFPYDYYTFERILNAEPGIISEAVEFINLEDRQRFISNIDTIGARLSADSFDMMKYCEFYCERDVEVLRLGFNQFASLAATEPLGMNVHDYLSAPTLAYEYMLQNVFYPNGSLYNVGGQLQKYLQKFVYGGRVMTKNNIRYDIRTKLADFDACSLYPSAMRRAFTVEGVPEYYKNPTPEQVFNKDNLPEILTKAFTEDQIRPTAERCYSQFFIEIQITNVGIPRAFPLIVKREANKQSNVNECVKMHVDMIMLQDLIEFQDISFTFVDGYVMKGCRDHRIRNVIKKLYDLRVEYKKTKNPMQEIIKLIMNSAYGKSIQKVIKTDLKFVNSEDISFKLYDWYHQIHKAEQISSDKWLVEKYKRKANQFNNCIFGITILSISKRIMNEVMCLAEDLGIEIYYQDTDSMHIEYDKVEYLNQEFAKKYSRELIGSGMGNFHTDFEPANAYCVRHISLGKKMYLDVLEFEDASGNLQHKNHIRLKGIPEQVIINHANKYFSGDVAKLYEHIFRGGTVDFNLLDGKVCMRASRNGTVEYVKKFDRKVRATSNTN